MADQLNEASLRQQLLDQYKYVGRIGLNELESGNLSVRLGDQMLISASGASADNISPNTIIFNWLAIAVLLVGGLLFTAWGWWCSECTSALWGSTR